MCNRQGWEQIIENYEAVIADRDNLLKSLALYVGDYHWKQLTTEQRKLLADITGYRDPFA